MLARYPSDDHQFLYNPERLNGILYLKLEVGCHDIRINYLNLVLNVFKPAELENRLQTTETTFVGSVRIYFYKSKDLQFLFLEGLC